MIRRFLALFAIFLGLAATPALAKDKKPITPPPVAMSLNFSRPTVEFGMMFRASWEGVDVLMASCSSRLAAASRATPLQPWISGLRAPGG